MSIFLVKLEGSMISALPVAGVGAETGAAWPVAGHSKNGAAKRNAPRILPTQ